MIGKSKPKPKPYDPSAGEAVAVLATATFIGCAIWDAGKYLGRKLFKKSTLEDRVELAAERGAYTALEDRRGTHTPARVKSESIEVMD
jgi:hypothetical protein